MTDYTWPATVVPSSSEWRLNFNTATFRSPLNGATRTVARGGDHWSCLLSCQNLDNDKRAALQAYAAKLRGGANRAIITDHAYRKRGALTANFLVNGGTQVGSSLICDGATAGVTNAMREGDRISVANLMYIVTADANSDGSGNITLSISPPLRTSPANDATVEILAPAVRMILEDTSVGWSNMPHPTGISSFSLNFREDVAV